MFKKEALIYDKFYREKNYEKEVETITPFLNSGKIVDIGCGTGRYAKIFEKHGFKVLGIEPCKEMTDIALGHGVSVAETSIECFESVEKFDNAVMLFDVFNFLQSPKVALKNIACSLRSGGRFVFDAWDITGSKSKFGVSYRNGILRLAYKKFLIDRVEVNFFFFPQFIYSKHELRLYSDVEIQRMVIEKGFNFVTKKENFWIFEKA